MLEWLNPILDRIPQWGRRFVDFRGRARRTEYLGIILANSILVVLSTSYLTTIFPVFSDDLFVVSALFDANTHWYLWLVFALNYLIGLWTFVFFVRRLHDQNLPGYWVPIVFILVWVIAATGIDLGPAFGIIILLAMLALFLIVPFRGGTIGPNRFGPDPRGWESQAHYDEQVARLKNEKY